MAYINTFVEQRDAFSMNIMEVRYTGVVSLGLLRFAKVGIVMVEVGSWLNDACARSTDACAWHVSHTLT